MKRPNNWLLPLAAGLMALLAVIVVVFIPKDADKGSSSPASAVNEAEAAVQAATLPAEINEEGNLVIYADRLSSEKVSFIRVNGDSRIELLSRLGDDGTVKAALGTCQSCNGSPGAYYTQEGNELKCNNCGLTFPISVLDSPGGGCHPIMMGEGIARYDGSDLVIDLDGLSVYEELFSKTAEH